MQGLRGKGYDGHSNHHFPSLVLVSVKEALSGMGMGALLLRKWSASVPVTTSFLPQVKEQRYGKSYKCHT